MSYEEEIVLGFSQYGNPITIPLYGYVPSIAICGTTRSGKSVLLGNNILTQYMEKLRSKVSITVIDPKLTSMAHLASRVNHVTEPSQFLPTLQAFQDLVMRRYADMKKLGVSKLGREHMDEYPLQLLVLEEALSIVQNDDISSSAQKKIMSLYTTLFTRAKAALCGVMVCSHWFGTDCLPSVARDMLDTRILMKTNGADVVKLLADPDEAPAHLLVNSGEFYSRVCGENYWVRGKTWMTSDEEARAIADKYSLDYDGDSEVAWNVSKPE